MIESIEGIGQGTQFDGIIAQARRANTPEEKDAVKDKFMTLFYKEILKQVYKAPALGLDGEAEQNTYSAFSSDMMIDQMAMELAQKGSFSMDNVFPGAIK